MKKKILVFLVLALPFMSFADELIQFRVLGTAEGMVQYLDTLESSDEFNSKLSELESELKTVCAEGNWKLTKLKKTTKDIDLVCLKAIDKYKTENNEVYCVTFSLYDMYGDIDEKIQYLAYVFIVKAAEPYSVDKISKTVFRIDLGENDED